MADLPDCGLYKLRRALGDIPAGRLVYFHNHGNPGPGVYLPASWHQNRARFHERGTPLPDASWGDALEPLRPEGLYRVDAPFECCDKRCRTFEAGALVQLGYDGEARPILFTPEWRPEGLHLPERGTAINQDRVQRLDPLKVAGTSAGADRVVH